VRTYTNASGSPGQLCGGVDTSFPALEGCERKTVPALRKQKKERPFRTAPLPADEPGGY